MLHVSHRQFEYSNNQQGQCCISVKFNHMTDKKDETRAALSYSARRYDSAICCSKMSRDAFLSEALYKADKVLEKLLEKFAAALLECACLQDGGRSRR